MAKKLVKVCLHYSLAVHISLQFDEYFLTEKIKFLISRIFVIFILNLKLVGIPCTLIVKN